MTTHTMASRAILGPAHAMLGPQAASSDNFSPLVLADRLIALAKDADSHGYAGTADRLVKLAYHLWDLPAGQPDRGAVAPRVSPLPGRAGRFIRHSCR